MSPQLKPHSRRYDLGKGIKLQLPFLCRGGCMGERGTWFNFKFEILYSVNTVLMSHSKATVAPSWSSGPLEIRCGPQRAIWSPLRTTASGDTADSSVVAHSLLTCLLFNVVYISMSIYYVMNVRTFSSYIFLWKTSAHKDLNNVGLLQHCDDSLSIIMMYMNLLTPTFQPNAFTQHVWQSPHTCQHKQFYRCNWDSDGGVYIHIRTEIKKSLQWSFH